MFKGKVSFLKNLGYLLLLGVNTVIVIYFLLNTYLNSILTILASTSLIILVGLAFYSFLTSKSYYYYFYTGIIMSSIPIILVFYFSAIIIVPEVVVLLVLLFNGLNKTTDYYKMRVNKEANLLQHDPAVSGILRMTPGYPAIRMDEVWNPDSALPTTNEGVEVKVNIYLLLLTILLSSVLFVYAITSDFIFGFSV